MFKEHEKFWAFMVLIAAVVLLAIVATNLGARLTGSETLNEAAASMLTAKLRILELIAVGLIGIAGAAGQSLFRTNENAKDMNEILRSTIESLAKSQPLNDNQPAPKNVAEAADQVAEAAREEAKEVKAGGK
jgi:hypothetical protein